MAKTFNIALFGNKSTNGETIQLKEWSQAILDLCKNENIEPDYTCIKLQKRKPSKLKLGTFRSRLMKIDNDKIDYLNLIKSVPNFSYISLDWELCSSIETNANLNSIYIGFDIEKLQMLFQGKLKILVNQFKFMEVDYGFCFTMELKFGPALYVSGMFLPNHTEILDRFNIESTTLWSNYKPEAITAATKGKLRYLYEYNIINRSHLKRIVFGKTLEDWITSSAENGSLQSLNDKLFLWSIEPKRVQSLINNLMEQNFFIMDKNMKPNFE